MRVIYPEDYGAVADNATDSTAGLQGALDAAVDGSVIELDSGIYKINGLLTLPTKSVLVRGGGFVNNVNSAFGNANYTSKIRGTVIRQTSTTANGIAHDQNMEGNTTANWVLRDFAIVGPGSGCTTGLVMGSATVSAAYLKAYNVGIYNFSTGIDLKKSNSNQFYDMDIRGCATGINSAYTTEEIAFYSANLGFNTTGLKVTRGSGLSFYAPIFQNHTTAIWIAPNTTITKWFLFDSAFFEGNTVNALFDSRAYTISHVAFRSARGAGAGEITFLTSPAGVDFFTFTNCDFSSTALTIPSTSYGMKIDGSYFASVTSSNNGDYHASVSRSFTNGAGGGPENHASTMKTLTYASSIQLKWMGGESQRVTLTGNVTLTVPDDAPTGAKLTLYLLQDATGGREVAWSGFTYHAWSDVGNTANRMTSITMQKTASGQWTQAGAQSPYL